MFTDPFGLKPDNVEVIIWQSAGSGSSSAGYVSVRVNDRSYSMAPGGMDRRSFAEYRAKQGLREGMGMQLNVTAQQEKQIQGALESDPGKLQPRIQQLYRSGAESSWEDTSMVAYTLPT